MPDTLDTVLLALVRTRLVTEYPAHVAACLDALDDEAVWWRPHEGTNAVGNLVLHLIGSNRYHLDHVIAGAADTRDRDAEFAARGGVSRAELLRLWRASAGDAARVLDGVTPSRLLEPSGEARRTRSVAEVLLHVTHHNALHIGQIVWVTKMRHPGALHELTRGGPPAPPSA